MRRGGGARLIPQGTCAEVLYAERRGGWAEGGTSRAAATSEPTSLTPGVKVVLLLVAGLFLPLLPLDLESPLLSSPSFKLGIFGGTIMYV